MSIPLFFAMTGREIRENTSKPDQLAWMACHFSVSSPALTDFPAALPRGSMLILDDSIPFSGHDPQLICSQLAVLHSRLGYSNLLLDFERPPSAGVLHLAKLLVQELPCPVGMPVAYAQDLDCPIFLPPIPPHELPEKVLHHYQNREIWLEIALDGSLGTVTADGCSFRPLAHPVVQGPIHPAEALHSHYCIHAENDRAQFTFFRTKNDLQALLEDSRITLAIGLYQELGT